MTYDKPNRSDQYQWRFYEISVDSDALRSFRDEREQYNDALLTEREELLSQLKQHVRRLTQQLTPRQRGIVQMTVDGYTQQEIAAKEGLNQSTVQKVLSGCQADGSVKKYGGAYKKLRNLAAQDPEVQRLLQRWEETQRGQP